MTRAEFTTAMLYLETACRKQFTANEAEVYFDLLGDLPAAALLAGVKRVLLEHRWASLPTVAELREAAVEAQRGEVKTLSAAEAWALAWKAVGDTDPEVEGSFARATKDCPPLVVEAIRAMGLPALCYGDEPVGVLRGQFFKVFEQLAARQRRTDLYPAALKPAPRPTGELELISDTIRRRLDDSSARQTDPPQPDRPDHGGGRPPAGGGRADGG